MKGGNYDGIPLDQLPIDEVSVPDPVHLRRSRRYPGAMNIKPEHAMEAVLDRDRWIYANIPEE